MSKVYDELVAETQRLLMLRVLALEPGGDLGHTRLAMAVTGAGEKTSGEQAKQHLHWMATQGLVRNQMIGPIMLATITPRGHELVDGALHVAGVADPSRVA